MDADADTQSESECVENIVLHPGDTIGVASIDNNAIITLRGGRDGQPYAVLDCERNLDGHYIICDIRFVAARRGVLPVRAEPEPQPLTFVHDDTLDGDLVLGHEPVNSDDPNRSFGVNSPPTHGDARPIHLILSNFGRVTPIDPDPDDPE